MLIQLDLFQSTWPFPYQPLQPPMPLSSATELRIRQTGSFVGALGVPFLFGSGPHKKIHGTPQGLIGSMGLVYLPNFPNLFYNQIPIKWQMYQSHGSYGVFTTMRGVQELSNCRRFGSRFSASGVLMLSRWFLHATSCKKCLPNCFCLLRSVCLA